MAETLPYHDAMPQSSHRFARALSMLVACVSAIVALNVLETTPRFASAALNYAAVIVLALSIPAVLFWLAFAALASCARWAVVVIAVAVSIPLGFFSLFVFLELESVVAAGVDKSFEPLSELKGEPTHYRVYRTNGGATTADGIVLRRERDGLPGVKLVSVVRAYRAHDATLQRLPSGMIELRVAPYGPGEATQRFEFSP